MKKTTAKTLCFGSTLLLLSLSACVKDMDLSQTPPTPVKGDYFDFETTLHCPINIDLGLKDYSVLVEIYSENPFTDKDGVATKKDIEPIYRGITDSQGKLDGLTVLPSYVKKAYIYSPYLGVPFFETEITAGGIFVNTESHQTRAINTRSMPYTYPSDMKVIGDWNEFGYPAYLLPSRFAFPENELYYISKATTISGRTGLQEFFPEYFTSNIETGIPIIKKTKVNLTIIGKYAPSVNNTIFYYTYPTGQVPTSVKDIQKIVAYPVSKNISCGSTIELRYWNQDTQQLENEFPAGVTIGYGISSNAFKDGNIGNSGGDHNYYSIKELNTKKDDVGNQHTITIFDKENNSIIIGIEDRPLNQTPNNFTDVVLYCHTDIAGAINGNELPELKKPESPGPSEADNVTTYFGQLAFEDLWPKQGDYDLNDVVIYYESKVYKNQWNQITATEDLILPYWDGAGYNKINGFGYQLAVAPGKIASMQIISENYAFSASNLFQFDSKGLEISENDNAIIIVTDNIKKAVSQKSRFTVKTVFTTPQQTSVSLLPPYNPFIIVDANIERGREVHLPNFSPTKLVDQSYFGKENDISDKAQQMYYIAKDNMPYAIHLSGIKDFDYPEEEVRIDTDYPEFARWAHSKGSENTDWYLHKKK